MNCGTFYSSSWYPFSLFHAPSTIADIDLMIKKNIVFPLPKEMIARKIPWIIVSNRTGQISSDRVFTMRSNSLLRSSSQMNVKHGAAGCEDKQDSLPRWNTDQKEI